MKPIRAIKVSHWLRGVRASCGVDPRARNARKGARNAFTRDVTRVTCSVCRANVNNA